MTFLATPHPETAPPSVELDYTLDVPGSIISYEITRNGETLRINTVPSGDRIIVFDNEAEFGVPLSYVISGRYLPAVTPDWTESWASLAAWTGDTADWSVAGGEASSDILNADITRTASGEIQRMEVTDPAYVRVELLDASDAVVTSVSISSQVVLQGAPPVAGGGSFILTLNDGSVQAAAADNSWGVLSTYTGVPEKVRVVSLFPAYGLSLTADSVGAVGDFAFDSSGNLLTLESGTPNVHKYDPVTGAEITGGGFPFSAHPNSRWLATDSSGFSYTVESGPTTPQIHKYDSSGVEVVTGGFPIDLQNFALWNGLAVGSDGSIYVIGGTDFVADRILKFDTAGVEVVTGGFPIVLPTVTGGQYGLAIDSADYLYITQGSGSAGTIQQYDSSGVLTDTIDTDVSPSSLDVDPTTGNIAYLTNTGVAVRDSSGTLLFSKTITSPDAVQFDPATEDLWVNGPGTQMLRYSPMNASVGEISVYLEESSEEFSDSTSTQLDVETAWMIHPFNPGLSLEIGKPTGCAQEGIEVSPETKRTAVSQTRSVLLNPVGRRRWIAITQQDRMVATWTLVLHTETLSDRDDILNFLIADVPFLLRSPESFDWDLPDDWYSIQDVNDDRETYYMVPGPCGHHYHRLSLPLFPVDPPAEPVPPSWTYGQGFLLNETYADSLTAEPTYLDRLVGPAA